MAREDNQDQAGGARRASRDARARPPQDDAITVDTRRGRPARREDPITVDTRRTRRPTPAGRGTQPVAERVGAVARGRGSGGGELPGRAGTAPPSSGRPRTPGPATGGTNRRYAPRPAAGPPSAGLGGAGLTPPGGTSGQPSARFARGIVLTALGTLIPGAGLALTRRRRLGLVVLGVAVVLLCILGIVVAVKGTIGTAATALTLTGAAFALLLLAIATVTLLWVVSIIATAVVARPRAVSTRLSSAHKAFAGVMCLLVLVPGIRVVQFVGLTHQTSDAVYTPRYTGRPDAFAPNLGRENILLLGSDAGPDRTGVRTDSMMVMSSNTSTGATTLISIPRNLQGVPFAKRNPLHKLYPNGYRCADQSCLMNAVWQEAETKHRDLFAKKEKNPGLDTTREVIEQIIGMRIDYTVVVNLKGFQQLVDALGGVYVTVPYKLAIGGSEEPAPGGGYRVTPGSIKGYIKPGYQKLDGYHALWYSRSRVQSSDDDRMRRQRCMVNALVNQADPLTLLRRFPAIIAVAQRNISTDVPHSQLGQIAGVIAKAKNSKIRTVSLSPPAISSYQPDFAKIRSLIHQAVTAKPAKKKSAARSAIAKRKAAAKKNPAANKTTSC